MMAVFNNQFVSKVLTTGSYEGVTSQFRTLLTGSHVNVSQTRELKLQQ